MSDRRHGISDDDMGVRFQSRPHGRRWTETAVDCGRVDDHNVCADLVVQLSLVLAT